MQYPDLIKIEKTGNTPETLRRCAVVTCSGCGTKAEVTMPGKMLPPDMIVQKVRGKGWNMSARKGQALCYQCVKKKRNKGKGVTAPVAEAAGTTHQPITQMTPDLRRKIFRAIDPNYRPNGGGYIAGFTDQSIAERHGIDPSLVKQVREEAFGPAHDHALTQIDKALANLDKLASEREEQALTLAAQWEETRDEIKKIRALALKIMEQQK